MHTLLWAYLAIAALVALCSFAVDVAANRPRLPMLFAASLLVGVTWLPIVLWGYYHALRGDFRDGCQ